MHPYRRVVLTPSLIRARGAWIVMWLAACGHPGATRLAQPLPAHLPPATPPAADAAAARQPVSTARVPVAFVLSEQAQRFLLLEYRAFSTEFMGCMIGGHRGDTLVVERIAPADVAPSHSTATWVIPTQTCESAGWTSVVGTIHNHVGAVRCWYFFPGTRVPSADAEMFGRSPYAIDAIMCGDRVVWIDRRMEQRELALPDPGGALP